MPQLRATEPRVIRRDAQAMASRLLPVNSSAPPTITRIRPSENASPAAIRTKPYGTTPALPAATVVAKAAPSATNAPASTASTNVGNSPATALRAPTSLALAAISDGRRASRRASLGACGGSIVRGWSLMAR